MADRKRWATCAEPGCPEVVLTTYCLNHRRAKDKAVKHRDAERREVYGTKRWRGVRRLILRRDQFCTCGVVCCPDGCLEISTVVDHIIPLQEDGAPFDPANLRGMAKRCHDRTTAQAVWHGDERV